MYDLPDIYVEHLQQKDETEQARQYALARETEKELVRREKDRIADKEEAAQRKILLTPASNYTKRNPEWLLDKRIPSNDLTLLIGKGGAAKSTMLALMCGYISNEVPILGAKHTIGHVIYCHCEDSVQETILPRLEAAGADLDRVHLLRVSSPLGEGLLRLPQDIDELMKQAVTYNVAAICYDPLSAFLFSSKGGRNDSDAMRQVYLQIQAAHEENHIAGLGLGHTRKALADSLLDAFMGSSEQGNVIRSAFGAIADPDIPGRFIMSQEKHNRAPQQPSLVYRIESATVPDASGYGEIDTSKVTIVGETTETASDVLRGASNWARREARRFIITFLAERGGEEISSEVVKAATDVGHTKPTMYRAAEELVQHGKITIQPLLGEGKKHTWQLALDIKIF